jgi:hypothetical protein
LVSKTRDAIEKKFLGRLSLKGSIGLGVDPFFLVTGYPQRLLL